jgi:hypothetical protein
MEQILARIQRLERKLEEMLRLLKVEQQERIRLEQRLRELRGY